MKYHAGWDEQMKAANEALDASLKKRRAPREEIDELPACIHCGADDGPCCTSCYESGQ